MTCLVEAFQIIKWLAFFGCFTPREDKIPSLELGLLRNLEKKNRVDLSMKFLQIAWATWKQKRHVEKIQLLKSFEVVGIRDFLLISKETTLGMSKSQTPPGVSSLRKIVIHPLWLSSNQKIHQKCGTLLIMSCFQK